MEGILRDLGEKEISSPEGVNYYLGVIKGFNHRMGWAVNKEMHHVPRQA